MPNAAPSPTQRLRAILPWVLIPLGTFLWFWIFRAERWTGGDSEQYSRDIAAGMWLRKRQMLSFAALQFIHSIFHPLLGWSADLAFNFASCLSGAAAMTIAWRILRGRPGWPWPWIFFFAAPFTTIFHGHIETYAMPAAALLLHLLAVQRSREDAWPLWTIAATYLLFALFHLVAFFLLPSLALILVLEAQRRGVRRADLALGLSALAGVPIFLWVLINTNVGNGEMIGGATVHPVLTLMLKPWKVFDQVYYPDKLYFLALNTGLSLPFMLLAFWRGRNNRLSNYWLAHLVCFLNFFAIWRPFQRENDWDLFCFPWIVGSLALARSLMLLPRRAIIAGMVLGGDLILWSFRPLMFSSFARHEHGSICFQADPAEPLINALIDDRVGLEAENKFLRPGGHIITIFETGHPPLRRIVRVEAGQTYRLRLRGGRLELVE